MPSEKASFTAKDPVSVTSGQSVPVQSDGSKSSNKASFYARDPAPLSSSASKGGKKKYMGEERRRSNRRTGQNRRVEVRFELNKTDRRQSEGRRETDATVKFW